MAGPTRRSTRRKGLSRGGNAALLAVRQLIYGGKFRGVPAAPQRLHQQDARAHAASQDIQGLHLVLQKDGLLGDNRKVVSDTGLCTGKLKYPASFARL